MKQEMKHVIPINSAKAYRLANALRPGPDVITMPFNWRRCVFGAFVAGEAVLLVLDWRWWVCVNLFFAVAALYLWPDPHESKVKS